MRRKELENEYATLQADIGRQRAEAERDLLKTALERERVHLAQAVEQGRRQGELLARLTAHSFSGSGKESALTTDDAGFVHSLVGHQAVKRCVPDITRAVSAAVGLGSDARILIMDMRDYASGDIPCTEVTSQLSVFEVRCRKQVATNRELADLSLENGDKEEGEMILATRAGTSRLSPLAAAPPILPAVPTAITAISAITGLIGTEEDLVDATGTGHSHYRSIPAGAESLLAAVAGSLKSERRHVYIYNFYAMDTTGPQSKLMNMYAGILDCSGRLAQSRNRLLYLISKRTDRHAELKLLLQNTPDDTPAAADGTITDIRDEIRKEGAWLDRAAAEVLASDAIHAELGSYVRLITSADAGQPVSKLAQAVCREKVHELGITHLLYLGVPAAGGESVARRTVLGSGTVSYLGGAVVTYVLSRVEGEVLASDTLPVLYSFEFDPAGQRNTPLKPVRFERTDQKK